MDHNSQFNKLQYRETEFNLGRLLKRNVNDFRAVRIEDFSIIDILFLNFPSRLDNDNYYIIQIA